MTEVWTGGTDGAAEPGGGGDITTEVWNKGMYGAEDDGGIITEAEIWRGGTDGAGDGGSEGISGGEKLLLDIAALVEETDGVVLRVGGVKVGGVRMGGAAGITVLT